jgi:hypothetical protein
VLTAPKPGSPAWWFTGETAKKVRLCTVLTGDDGHGRVQVRACGGAGKEWADVPDLHADESEALAVFAGCLRRESDERLTELRRVAGRLSELAAQGKGSPT